MKMPLKCIFKKAQNLNLEAYALSYILIVLVTVFLYNEQHDLKTEQDDLEENQKFSFNQWISQMQNPLSRVKDFAFGM